jgi:hypothetical protein
VNALVIVEPDTVIHWHRAGFRLFWRWKSRRRGGRPKVPLEIRQLVLDLSRANPLWGAPWIHGELLKLGIDVGQTSVAKYMAKHRQPPSQGWKTFLRNHADGIASIDLSSRSDILVSTALRLADSTHGRRQILRLGVTAHPSAEKPAAGNEVHRPRSRFCLWQIVHPAASCHGLSRPANRVAIAVANGHTERWIGSIRRECLDHVVVFGERHLHHVLLSYMAYLQLRADILPGCLR